MGAIPVVMHAIACDWPKCRAMTAPRASVEEAFIEWRSEHDGMLFLAGRWRDLGGNEPEAYLCGEHWHWDEGGQAVKGSKPLDSASSIAC